MTLNELLKLVISYSKIENKTKRQELEYDYVDKAYQYYSLKKTATDMGNKKPNDNFLVKRAYENMIKAHNELLSFEG